MDRLVRLIREIPGAASSLKGLDTIEPKWGARPKAKLTDVLPDDATVKVFADKIIQASRFEPSEPGPQSPDADSVDHPPNPG